MEFNDDQLYEIEEAEEMGEDTTLWAKPEFDVYQLI